MAPGRRKTYTLTIPSDGMTGGGGEKGAAGRSCVTCAYRYVTIHVRDLLCWLRLGWIHQVYVHLLDSDSALDVGGICATSCYNLYKVARSVQEKNNCK